MKYLSVIIIVFFLLTSCSEKYTGQDFDQQNDSIATLSPSDRYNFYAGYLRTSPDNNGVTYKFAYYSAVKADSAKAYAQLLDSLAAVDTNSRNRNYIATFRALCAYMCADSNLDSLVNAAVSLPPPADALQETVTAPLLARMLMMSDPKTAYALQLRALAAMKKCSSGIAPELLTQAAEISCQLGEYATSMEHLNEAHDSLEACNWPVRETVFYYGNKANLYSTVEMFDSALVSNRRALEAARFNPTMLIDVLTFRARIFAGNGPLDSAVFYLDSAERVIGRMNVPYTPMLLKYVRSQRAMITIHTDSNPTTMSRCIAELTDYIGSTPGLWEEKFALAYARTKLKPDSALDDMEKIRDSIATHSDPALLLKAERDLINAYLRNGRVNDASRLYEHTFRLVDTLDLEHARYQSIAADIQYRARSHKRENHLLREAVAQKESRILWLGTACVLGLILLVWAIIFIIQSRRMARLNREINERQITQLLDNQKNLNRRIEDLQKLGQTETDWSKLTPSSMSTDDINNFRNAFEALYPGFTERLRSRWPDLTVTDDTLCMLIRIRQNSDEIALALGISRASVNSARYRVRKKMGLRKEDSLDDIISAI